MARLSILGFAQFAWAALRVVSLFGVTLEAGVAKVDITPPAGLPMYGYFSRTQLSTGTLDPLYARVLVLKAGDKSLALVTLDLGRTFGPSSLARLREQVAARSGISWLLITAPHTHAGPNIQDEYAQTPSWEAATLEKVAQAIDRAAQQAMEARVGTGRGKIDIGYTWRRMHGEKTEERTHDRHRLAAAARRRWGGAQGRSGPG